MTFAKGVISREASLSESSSVSEDLAMHSRSLSFRNAP